MSVREDGCLLFVNSVKKERIFDLIPKNILGFFFFEDKRHLTSRIKTKPKINTERKQSAITKGVLFEGHTICIFGFVFLFLLISFSPFYFPSLLFIFFSISFPQQIRWRSDSLVLSLWSL